MSKFLLFFLLVAITVLSWILFGDRGGEKKSDRTEPSGASSSESSFSEKTPLERASSETAFFSETLDILIEMPQENESVSSPFVVRGKARLSRKVFVRILSQSGKELISESANLLGPFDDEGYDFFQMKLRYEFTNTKEGFLEVSGKNQRGKEVLVKIPLKFSAAR